MASHLWSQHRNSAPPCQTNWLLLTWRSEEKTNIDFWIDGFLSGEEKEGKMGRNFPSSAWQIFQEGQGYILIDVIIAFWLTILMK